MMVVISFTSYQSVPPAPHPRPRTYALQPHPHPPQEAWHPDSGTGKPHHKEYMLHPGREATAWFSVILSLPWQRLGPPAEMVCPIHRAPRSLVPEDLWREGPLPLNPAYVALSH